MLNRNTRRRSGQTLSVLGSLLVVGFLFPVLTNAQTRQSSAPTRRAARPANTDAQANVVTKALIVATVNGQEVTRQHLAKQCLERFGKDVLESLVNKHLILEECRKKNIRITQQDVEQEIDRVAKNFSLPREQLLEMLQRERNISPEQYRRDIIWPTLALRHLSTDRLNVTKADLQKEFESEYGSKVQVRMIALETKAEAEKILKTVQAAPDQFSMLAKKHSIDPNSAAARGLIPPIRKHIGDATVEKTCFELQPGEISKVVEVAGQFLVFKCERHLPAAQISPQYRKQAYDRLRERIYDRKLREASGDVFESLQKDAKVVNVFNDAELRKKHPGVAATINGKQIPIATLAEECIERHGVPVLESEISYLLLRQALKTKQLQVTGEDLDAEVARAAESYGYVTDDDKPDVKSWMVAMTEQEGISPEVYLRDAVWPSVALKKLVKDEVTITQEDLDRGFDANYGPRVEVLAIVLGSQRKAQEVWNETRKNATAEHFGELASRHSIEPVSRANMGEVPPIRRYSGQPQVEEVAFKLAEEHRKFEQKELVEAPDPVSGIIAVADKYIILFYKGLTEPLVEDREIVQGELVRELKEKKLRLAMSQEFTRLRSVARIDNFLSGSSQGTEVSPTQVGQTSQPRQRRQAARSNPTLVRPASVRTRK